MGRVHVHTQIGGDKTKSKSWKHVPPGCTPVKQERTTVPGRVNRSDKETFFYIVEAANKNIEDNCNQ
jgi:hypothetical protein